MISNSGKHPCGCPLCYEMQEFQSHRRQEGYESRREQMSWLIALDLAENSQVDSDSEWVETGRG